MSFVSIGEAIAAGEQARERAFAAEHLRRLERARFLAGLPAPSPPAVARTKAAPQGRFHLVNAEKRRYREAEWLFPEVLRVRACSLERDDECNCAAELAARARLMAEGKAGP